MPNHMHPLLRSRLRRSKSLRPHFGGLGFKVGTHPITVGASVNYYFPVSPNIRSWGGFWQNHILTLLMLIQTLAKIDPTALRGIADKLHPPSRPNASKRERRRRMWGSGLRVGGGLEVGL